MTQGNETAAVEQGLDALADCLAEILRKNGYRSALHGVSENKFRVFFKGVYGDGEQALALVEGLARDAGYEIDMMAYMLFPTVGNKEPLNRCWSFHFIPTGSFDETP